MNRIARKAVKVYLSSPLQKLIEELTGYLGLSESEVLRMGLFMIAEKYGIRVRGG